MTMEHSALVRLQAENDRLRAQIDPDSARHWDTMREERDAARADLDKANAQLADAAEEAAWLRGLLNRDQTGLAEALNRVRQEVRGRRWIGEDHWASYSYEEHTPETLRREWRWFEEQVLGLIESALAASGQRADAAFHRRRSQ